MKLVILAVLWLVAPSGQAEAAGVKACPSNNPKCAQARTVKPAQHVRKGRQTWVNRSSYRTRDVYSMSAKEFYMYQMLNN
jgi:hypothetical protein